MPSSRRRSVPSRRPRSVSSATSGRKSDSKITLSKGIAEPGERLALPGDHPGARLRPQLQRLAGRRRAPASSVRRPCRRRAPTSRATESSAPSSPPAARPARRRTRRNRGRRSGRSSRRRRTEPVVGAAAVRPPPPSPPPCCGRRRRSGCGARPAPPAAQRGGERVAEREVAEVADVERLGRVGAPEVDGVALARRRGRRVGASALPPASSAAPFASIQSSARRTSTPVAGSTDLAPTARRRSARAPQRARGRPRQSRRRGTSIRSQSRVRAERRARRPRTRRRRPRGTPSMLSKRFPAIAPSPRTLPIANAPAGARTRITGFQVRSFNRLRHWCSMKCVHLRADRMTAARRSQGLSPTMPMRPGAIG